MVKTRVVVVDDSALVRSLLTEDMRDAFVREAIETVGATLMFLPPYSPDLNPIEQAFAKFKWLLKSAAQRTVEALWNTCGQLLERFTEPECRNYIQHCGYRYT